MAISFADREVVKRSRNGRTPVLTVGTVFGSTGSATGGGGSTPSGNYANLLVENTFNEDQYIKKEVIVKTLTVGDWVNSGNQVTLDVYNAGLRSQSTKFYINDFLLERSALGVLDIEGAANVMGDINIYGDIYQHGEAYETHAQELYTANDLIISRDGATAALAGNEYAGLKVMKYDGVNNLLFGIDVDGWGRIGDEGGTMQKLATMSDSISDNTLIQYNNTDNKFYGSNTLVNQLKLKATAENTNLLKLESLDSDGRGVEIGFSGTDDTNIIFQRKYSYDLYTFLNVTRSSGAIEIENNLKLGSTTAGKHLEFKRGDYNYITAPSSGGFAFLVNGASVDSSNALLLLKSDNTFQFNQSGIFSKTINTPTFASGFTGKGWQIDEYGNVYVKSLEVRGAFKAYSFTVEEMKVGTGSQLFTEGITIAFTAGSNIYYNNRGFNVFSVGQILRCQQWDGTSQIKYYQIEVSAVGLSGTYQDENGEYLRYIQYTNKDGSDSPAIGDNIARVSGTVLEVTSRGGTSNNQGFLQIANGITATTGSFNTLLRVGYIDGMSSTAKGSNSSGYGIHTDNFVIDDDGAYLSGTINASAGEIADFTIVSNNIYDSNSSKYIAISNSETSSPDGSNRWRRGFHVYNDNTVCSEGGFKFIRIGMLTNKDTYSTWPSTVNYGIQISKFVSGATVKDVFRVDKDGALIAGWNFDETYLWTGTKQTSDAYTTSGMTIGNGALRSENFRIDTNGDVFARNAYFSNVDVSGRIATDFDDVTINSSTTLTISPTTNNINLIVSATDPNILLAFGSGTWKNGQQFTIVTTNRAFLYGNASCPVYDGGTGLPIDASNKLQLDRLFASVLNPNVLIVRMTYFSNGSQSCFIVHP